MPSGTHDVGMTTVHQILAEDQHEYDQERREPMKGNGNGIISGSHAGGHGLSPF
jgi:hypothetical protein